MLFHESFGFPLLGFLTDYSPRVFKEGISCDTRSIGGPKDFSSFNFKAGSVEPVIMLLLLFSCALLVLVPHSQEVTAARDEVEGDEHIFRLAMLQMQGVSGSVAAVLDAFRLAAGADLAVLPLGFVKATASMSCHSLPRAWHELLSTEHPAQLRGGLKSKAGARRSIGSVPEYVALTCEDATSSHVYVVDGAGSVLLNVTRDSANATASVARFTTVAHLAVRGEVTGVFNVSVGVLLGDDLAQPMAARTLMVAGAEVILNPTRSVLSSGTLIPTMGVHNVDDDMLLTRGFENSAAVVRVNSADHGSTNGRSAIANWCGPALYTAYDAGCKNGSALWGLMGALPGVSTVTLSITDLRQQRQITVWGDAFRRPYTSVRAAFGVPCRARCTPALSPMHHFCTALCHVQCLSRHLLTALVHYPMFTTTAP